MQKDLSEMSLEELWQLFPIQLSEPQPHWINWYEEEAHHLKKLLSLSEELRYSDRAQRFWNAQNRLNGLLIRTERKQS